MIRIRSRLASLVSLSLSLSRVRVPTPVSPLVSLSLSLSFFFSFSLSLSLSLRFSPCPRVEKQRQRQRAAKSTRSCGLDLNLIKNFGSQNGHFNLILLFFRSTVIHGKCPFRGYPGTYPVPGYLYPGIGCTGYRMEPSRSLDQIRYRSAAGANLVPGYSSSTEDPDR